MTSKIRFLLLALLMLTACTFSAEVAEVPTVAVLPSLTPTSTQTATATDTPTITPSPTATWTPNMKTEVAQGNETNEAAQATLVALWTRMASTSTYTPSPTFTLTPSQTITMTLTPPPTTEPVRAMQPTLLYIRSLANLRSCPQTACARVAQLRERDTVMATGVVNGEAVSAGNAVWYQIDHEGQQVYIYSNLVSTSLPTPVPPTATTIYVYIQPTAVPYMPPSVPDYQYPTSPPSSGSGATARCRDGTLSYSAHRQGTCSGHGGVAEWYP